MTDRDIERVVQGSFEDLKQHLETMAQQNWPGLPLHVYDSTLTKYHPPGPVETRMIDGRKVSFNWPQGDWGHGPRLERVEAEARKLDERFPGADPDQPVRISDTIASFINGDAQIRGPRVQQHQKITATVLGDVPSVYGSTMDFPDSSNSGKELRAIAVGMDSHPCSHCAATASQIAPPNCDQLDPHQARLQQLARYFVGFHEVAHAVDIHTGAAEELIHKDRILSTADVPNTKESLADSWATLMSIRDLGSEGEAFTRLWANVRTHPLGGSSHQTAGALQASRDWATANPDQLASMTPQQLFEQAKTLTVGATRTNWELDKINDHKTNLTNILGKNGSEISIEEAELAHQPGQIRGRLQQAESKQIFEGPRGRVPAVVVEYDRQMLHAAEGRQQALDDLARLNPLNTPEWREREAERAGWCEVDTELQKLTVAREKLQRLKQWDKEQQHTETQPPEVAEPETQKPPQSASGPKMP